MEADDLIGKKVEVYDEGINENLTGEIVDYYPGRGYRKYSISMFFLCLFSITCLLVLLICGFGVL